MSENDFDEMLKTIAENLSGFVCRRVRDAATAADLMQETLVKAWREAASFRGEGPSRRAKFWAWARQIALNVITDHYRRTGRRREAQLVAEVAEQKPSGELEPGSDLIDASQFPEVLLGKLRESGADEFLVRFVEAGIRVRFNKVKWAAEMEFGNPRSVDAYIHRLRLWCAEKGMRPEEYLAGTAIIVWLGVPKGSQGAALTSAASERGPEQDHERTSEKVDRFVDYMLTMLEQRMPSLVEVDLRSQAAVRSYYPGNIGGGRYFWSSMPFGILVHKDSFRSEEDYALWHFDFSVWHFRYDGGDTKAERYEAFLKAWQWYGGGDPPSISESYLYLEGELRDSIKKRLRDLQERVYVRVSERLGMNRRWP